MTVKYLNCLRTLTLFLFLYAGCSCNPKQRQSHPSNSEFLDAITCKIDMEETKSIFLKGSNFTKGLALGSIFGRNPDTSILVAITANPVPLLNGHTEFSSNTFMYSIIDYARSDFPAISWSEFTGDASPVIEHYKMKENTSKRFFFAQVTQSNGDCKTAIYLKKNYDQTFSLGCGWC